MQEAIIVANISSRSRHLKDRSSAKMEISRNIIVVILQRKTDFKASINSIGSCLRNEHPKEKFAARGLLSSIIKGSFVSKLLLCEV